MELRLSEVALVVGGRLVGADLTVSGASIDSRTVGRGQLFVPIVAERDGHQFIPAALDAGAAAYLTAQGAATDATAPAVVVDDTAAALSALARHARRLLDGGDRNGRTALSAGEGNTGRPGDTRVIGVTGSVGKTTVKDLLAAVLRADRPTWASERSLNNELGVPLTILNAPADTEALVVEMGARGAGHIKALCDLAAPHLGVVTRVAAAHTELFGTLDDVAAAKAELVEALPPTGSAVLNAADDRVLAMRSATDAQVVTFGADGDVRAEEVVLDDELRPSFRLVSPWGDADLRLATARGLHMVENSLGAAAAALAVGAPVETVANALPDAPLSPWRMELRRAAAGGVVLNDAYNANPMSMAAALHSLAALPAERKMAVLGLMAELGGDSETEHGAIGELARDLGLDVIAVDVPAYGGTMVADVDEAAAAVGSVTEGVAVLVKASRVAALERLADRLTH